jgi:hypothetical protein
VSPVHKAKDKPGNSHMKDDNPVIVDLCNHFSEMDDLSESVATRIVCKVPGKVTEHDNNNNAYYLPMCLQKRLLCHQFCKGQS